MCCRNSGLYFDLMYCTAHENRVLNVRYCKQYFMAALTRMTSGVSQTVQHCHLIFALLIALRDSGARHNGNSTLGALLPHPANAMLVSHLVLLIYCHICIARVAAACQRSFSPHSTLQFCIVGSQLCVLHSTIQHLILQYSSTRPVCGLRVERAASFLSAAFCLLSAAANVLPFSSSESLLFDVVEGASLCTHHSAASGDATLILVHSHASDPQSSSHQLSFSWALSIGSEHMLSLTSSRSC